MRIKLFVILIILIAILVTVPSVAAIINGQPDGPTHPYVAVAFDGFGNCSGTLVSPTIMVTAAHCFSHQESGAVIPVFVADENGFLVADPNDPFNPNNPYLFAGTWHPHPLFCEGCDPGMQKFMTHDIGVIELNRAVPLDFVDRYAQLPTEGLTEDLPEKSPLTLIGFGVQEILRGNGPPQTLQYPIRMVASSQLITSSHKNSDEFIRITANPSKGKGTACSGDSGGPILLENTDIMLALISYGTNSNCTGLSYSSRIGKPEILMFIRDFLGD